MVMLPTHVFGPKYERRQRPRNSQGFLIGKSQGNLAMTPDVAGVISLNRFMAPVDDNVTAKIKHQSTKKVKAKLDNYQHDYSERNFLFLPAVMTTSGRISGDFLRLLYILAHRQAANFFTSMGIPDPSSKAYKQRRGTYFYYNSAAITIVILNPKS